MTENFLDFSCACYSGLKLKDCCYKKTKRAGNGVLRHAYTYPNEDEFYPRMMFQMYHMRDCVFQTKEQKDEFNFKYKAVFQNMVEAKMAKEETEKLIDEHIERVKDSTAAKLDAKNTIVVEEVIDNELNFLFKDFFIRGDIAFDGLKTLAKMMDFDIGFVFKKDAKYDKEKAEFLKQNLHIENINDFLKMVDSHRKGWFANFIKFRNMVEHEGYKLPDMEYALTANDKIIAWFPILDGMTIKEILSVFWKHFFIFCEDTLVFLFSFLLPKDRFIAIVPEDRREQSNYCKYQVELKAFPGVRLSC